MANVMAIWLNATILLMRSTRTTLISPAYKHSTTFNSNSFRAFLLVRACNNKNLACD
jgi:hypothetical protein